MEEGTKSKKTVFVGGIGDDVDETVILENFSPFGDVIEVQLPTAPSNPSHPNDSKHRGFAFVTYSSPADAQDAIDNMDLNELNGRVLRVNLARPMKGPLQPQGNRAIWESEEWLQKNVKPLGESGGHALRAQTAAGGGAPGEEGEAEEGHEDENAMEE
ncbi:RNA-binding domain-containing protein [Trametes versicolor FP-101664 SS1]|uniref:RNA-binding domain-containing protein n=1 Tax=Trametes versicolor (strain FP-101664) TaxID=717944 RepID=UPI0004622A44|nr:RNA-binding domain-containing protein [Trametes versicolor FP-101664 SS1]EIW59977.1 RNA-binding domain-containing protein [Trametes versicolor FP-101664 SS1]